MELSDFYLFGFIILIIGMMCFVGGIQYSQYFPPEVKYLYNNTIQPALRDCLHSDYYYQDSHRPLCDALGVNSTK